MARVSDSAGCAGTCRGRLPCRGRPLAFWLASCYTGPVPYIEPEEYRPEPPLRVQITGPLPWEDPALSWPRRFFSTLGTTFAPLRTIHAVADGTIGPALAFALLSSAPFMVLWAIPPFTHTLIFKPEFGLEVMAKSDDLTIALDVLRALGIGLVVSVISLFSWALPFASLVRAFSNGTRPENPQLAAWRTALYRLWIIPLGTTLFSIAVLGMPKDPNPFAIELAMLGLQILPRILVLVHCHTMARYFGASGFGALVVSGVPLVVQWAVGLSVQQGAEMMLPPMPKS